MVTVRATLGGPGCGKTYSIAEEVSRLREGSDFPFGANERGSLRRLPLICSLTVAAAKEVAGRCGLSKNRAATIHSFARRSVRPILEDECQGKIKVAESKEGIAAWNDQLKYGNYRLTNVRQGAPTWDQGTRGNALLQQMNLYRLRREPIDRDDVLNFQDAWQTWKKAEGWIDYTDMLERAATDSIGPPGNPEIIFLDEAQDTSRLGLDILRRWAAQCDELVIVGDPRQSLFAGWAGAHPEIFTDDRIQSTKVLRRSHRLPRSIWEACENWALRLSDHRKTLWAPRRDAQGYVDGKTAMAPCSWKSPSAIQRYVLEDLGDRSALVLASCWHFLEPLRRALPEEALSKKPEPGKVCLLTVHAAKGKEADIVWVFPDLSAAGWKEWQLGQDSVVRVGYVALSRAREELYVCHADGSMAMPLHSALP